MKDRRMKTIVTTTATRYVLALAASLLLVAGTASAQTESVLYNFSKPSDVSELGPGGLVADSAGNIYGTASLGGAFGVGGVFELSPPAVQGGAWTETAIYEFTNGADGGRPFGTLIIDANCALYDTTYQGGDGKVGVVFQLTPPAQQGGAWTETILHSFSGSDGGNPAGGVIFGANGRLYGTAQSGGAGRGGVAYELTPPSTNGGTWAFNVIHNFSGQTTSPGGCVPEARLTAGPGGSFYGAAYRCGANGGGVAFKLIPPANGQSVWGEAVLHTFGAPNTAGDGNNPEAPLVVGPSGILYGTTVYGGSTALGTVYELIPPTAGGAWTENVIHSFGTGNDGTYPGGPVTPGSGGVLFGTAQLGGANSDGILFKLTPPLVSGGAWTETVPVTFNFADGWNPDGPLLLMNRALYGITAGGGSQGCSYGCGTVYEVTF